MKRIVLFFFLTGLFYLTIMWLLPEPHKVEKIVLKINRFEKELFSINSNNVANKSKQWDRDFGSFNEVFSRQILQISETNNDMEYYNALLAFTYNRNMREAYDSTKILFSDFSILRHELELAFSKFSTAFPDYPIPEITTFFGGFNYGVVTYDDNIGIGLENFLGKNSKFYKYLGDPLYLRFQKQKKFISSNVMEVWFNEHFQRYLVGRDFLAQMIQKGKMMFFLDQFLSELDIHEKFRFSKEEMSWVQENESSIWQYFVQEDLLFSNKDSDFRSYINYAPFAKGMPKEAPARVAYFIGYRIVSAYMKNNSMDVESLMYLTDANEFLKKSKYKPNK